MQVKEIKNIHKEIAEFMQKHDVQHEREFYLGIIYARRNHQEYKEHYTGFKDMAADVWLSEVQ